MLHIVSSVCACVCVSLPVISPVSSVDVSVSNYFCIVLGHMFAYLVEWLPRAANEEVRWLSARHSGSPIMFVE